MDDKQLVTLIALIGIPILSQIAILFLHFGWWGLLGRFIAFFLFMTMVIYLSVIVNLFGPRRYLYRLEDWENPTNQYKPTGYDTKKWNLLLDTHFHTMYSDGRLDIEQAALWHIAMGFNAFFVTDHDTMANQEEIQRVKEKYKDRVIIIQGLEVAPKICHLNILGLSRWDFDKFKGLEPREYIKEVVAEAHKQGAVVSINHYPWSCGGSKPRISPKDHPTREEAVEYGIDLIECANWDDDISPIDTESYEFCKAQDWAIAPVVGTDVHAPDKDKLWGWTLLNIPEFTEAAIMEELRSKRTDVLFAPEGIPYPTKHSENPKIKWLRPLYQLGDIFISFHKGGSLSNLDKGAIAIWLLYLLGFFGFLELARFLMV